MQTTKNSAIMEYIILNGKVVELVVVCMGTVKLPFFKGGRHLKSPKFEHIFVAFITFFPLSSVQILLIPACCLLCVL